VRQRVEGRNRESGRAGKKISGCADLWICGELTIG